MVKKNGERGGDVEQSYSIVYFSLFTTLTNFILFMRLQLSFKSAFVSGSVSFCTLPSTLTQHKTTNAVLPFCLNNPLYLPFALVSAPAIP